MPCESSLGARRRFPGGRDGVPADPSVSMSCHGEHGARVGVRWVWVQGAGAAAWGVRAQVQPESFEEQTHVSFAIPLFSCCTHRGTGFPSGHRCCVLLHCPARHPRTSPLTSPSVPSALLLSDRICFSLRCPDRPLHISPPRSAYPSVHPPLCIRLSPSPACIGIYLSRHSIPRTSCCLGILLGQHAQPHRCSWSQYYVKNTLSFHP